MSFGTLKLMRRIEDTNRALRALDYQYGGGACHDAVVGYLPRGMRMLGADAQQVESAEHARWDRNGFVEAGARPFRR